MVGAVKQKLRPAGNRAELSDHENIGVRDDIFQINNLSDGRNRKAVPISQFLPQSLPDGTLYYNKRLSMIYYFITENLYFNQNLLFIAISSPLLYTLYSTRKYGSSPYTGTSTSLLLY